MPYIDAQTEIDFEFHHDIENIKASKGDPCRLIGLELDIIKNTPAEYLNPSDIDNYEWRLPTDQENKDFSGKTTASAFTQHWWNIAGDPTNPITYYGVPGGEMPIRAASLDAPLMFLPAAGSRISDTISSQLNSGFY